MTADLLLWPSIVLGAIALIALTRWWVRRGAKREVTGEAQAEALREANEQRERIDDATADELDRLDNLPR